MKYKIFTVEGPAFDIQGQVYLWSVLYPPSIKITRSSEEKLRQELYDYMEYNSNEWWFIKEGY